MVETVPFAKNKEGEWEGELPNGQSSWGLKVYLIGDDVEKEPIFSHVQIYGLQPRANGAESANSAAKIETDLLFGWSGENGLRQLLEDVRGGIADNCESAKERTQKNALLRFSRCDWALIDESGETVQLFKAPIEDDEGWV